MARQEGWPGKAGGTEGLRVGGGFCFRHQNEYGVLMAKRTVAMEKVFEGAPELINLDQWCPAKFPSGRIGLIES
jgi:hypothetical protein